MLTAVELVQRQLDAYNARELGPFLANFSETITTYLLPGLQPTFTGKPIFAQFYATQRFNRPGLRAELLNRIVLGNKVFDHERIWGVREDPFDVVMVFEARDGLIQTLWGFSAECA